MYEYFVHHYDDINDNHNDQCTRLSAIQTSTVTVGTIVYTVLTLDPVRAPVACWGCVFIFCYSVYCIHLAGNSVSRTVQYIVSSYAMSPVTLVLKSQPIIASVMAGMAVYLHGRV